jgi:hypothetical protein
MSRIATRIGRQLSLAQKKWLTGFAIVMTAGCGTQDNALDPDEANGQAMDAGPPGSGAGGGSQIPVPGSSSSVDSSDAGAPVASSCYPFDPPSTSALRASAKKAFAFYYPPFPISLDNKAPSSDFWQTHWLDPNGGKGEYTQYGGYTRDRPIPRPPRPESNWRQLDFQREVKNAIAMGLDGFIYEYPDHVSSDVRQNQLSTMLAAAQAQDPGFRIMLSPDFPTGASATTDGLVTTISAVASHPSVYRLTDGSIVLASFYPERQPTTFWETLRTRLAANNIKVVFVPLFLSWSGSGKEDWNNTLHGYSSWGVRTVSSTNSYVTASTTAHSRGRIWMSPVAFEDVRFKDDDGGGMMRFWEASNSGLFRASFDKAIQGNADWISLTTWNDYTESWLSPSRERGYAAVDLGAYYVTWFKTGSAPAIVRDALYYFHRSQRSDAPYDTSKQTAGPIHLQGAGPVSDQVELLAFLKQPGRLVITQGSDVQVKDVSAAGMVSFKVPIVPGSTPVFELQRSGQTVQQVQSATPIQTAMVYQDMMYHGGGGLSCARPD